jgi:hypothetical protein
LILENEGGKRAAQCDVPETVTRPRIGQPAEAKRHRREADDSQDALGTAARFEET